jgi:hypothetical protein
MLKFYHFIFIIISFSFAYEVGETISMAHQNMDFDICYAPELDPNNDGVFNFSEYNGDLNGGQYYVIFLEMMATW